MKLSCRGTVHASFFAGQEDMPTMSAKPGAIGPVLPAIAGMFFISLLDAVGMISTGSTLGLALYYDLFGACGGTLIYTLVRWLRR
jgi:hypothetical protein